MPGKEALVYLMVVRCFQNIFCGEGNTATTVSFQLMMTDGKDYFAQAWFGVGWDPRPTLLHTATVQHDIVFYILPFLGLTLDIDVDPLRVA